MYRPRRPASPPLPCGRQFSPRERQAAPLSTQHVPLSTRRSTHAFLLALAAATFLIHGFHPFAEDGGIYAAGVEHALNPALFPHDSLFVTAYQAYSGFSPTLATIVRLTHLPLVWTFLLLHLLSIWTLAYAGLRIARLCFRSEFAARCAVSLLAAWFTLPIAGTALYFMEPYLTARSLSTPLALLSLSFALEPGARPRSLRTVLGITLPIAVAALFQPLMACHAAGFLAVLLVARASGPRTRFLGWTLLTLAAIILCITLQTVAHQESPATVLAIFSRYYWFLSQWQWFELLGILGPPLVLLGLARVARNRLTPAAIQLAHAAITAGIIATMISALFVQEHFHTHPIAKLQPLRAFLLIYAIMAILLGGTAASAAAPRAPSPKQRLFVPVGIALIAALMFFIQRQTFPASLHLELPGRPVANPWAQAFLWARHNTPPDALFALDARYVNLDGEDAQTFRAIAHRSAIPDFSKDGGVAANVAVLADRWQQGSAAQQHLSDLTDAERDARLAPFHPGWIILQTKASTQHPCPYSNSTVKVCVLAR